ncbi:uncharacterized protein LOC119667184 [Teleopsis dalmanni]|uniref:uncharacterized protein LOC119667184 n=1 Tax=Teleopsis dalmanni TaxID=139649 RepID=UPI0018CF6BE3|nr:uncharacterized protein LOC119667184 [Teleopsis dalmanni]
MHSFFQKDVDTKMLAPRTSAEKYWDRKYYLPKFGETSVILKERWFNEDAEEFIGAIEISSADDIEKKGEKEKEVPDINGSAKQNVELEFIPFEKKTSTMETSIESDPSTSTENVSERSDEDSNMLRKVLRNDIKLRFDKVKVDLKKLCAISNEKDPNEYVFEELCHCLNTNANVFYDSLLKALFVHTGSELKLYKKQINQVFKKMEWAHRKFFNIKFERLSDRFKKYLYYNSNVDFNMQEWTKMSRRLSHLKLYGPEVDNKKILLGNLRECVVEISGSPHMVFIKCIRDSLILCGPTESSIYIELCYDCVFLIAGKQLRIKYSTNCNIYSQIRNIIAIEACSELGFGKYNLFYRNIENDFAKAGMVFNDDYTGKIVDANWPNKTKSPHWTVLDSKVAASAWFEYKENLLAKIRKAKEEKKEVDEQLQEIIPDLKSSQIVEKEKNDKERNDKEKDDTKNNDEKKNNKGNNNEKSNNEGKNDKKKNDETKNDVKKIDEEKNDKKKDDEKKNEKKKNEKKNDNKNEEKKNDEMNNEREMHEKENIDGKKIDKEKNDKNNEENNDNEKTDKEINDKENNDKKKNDEKKIDEGKNPKEKNVKEENDKEREKNNKKKNDKEDALNATGRYTIKLVTVCTRWRCAG